MGSMVVAGTQHRGSPAPAQGFRTKDRTADTRTPGRNRISIADRQSSAGFRLPGTARSGARRGRCVWIAVYDEGGRMATAAERDTFVRPDGAEKVTGVGRYTADLDLPGQLHARFRYADHPRARILRIDTARARAHPG